MLKIGTDTWVLVVNDDVRAQGGYRAKRAWGRDVWKVERDREASEQSGAASHTSSGGQNRVGGPV